MALGIAAAVPVPTCANTLAGTDVTFAISDAGAGAVFCAEFDPDPIAATRAMPMTTTTEVAISQTRFDPTLRACFPPLNC
jgi:hypothetical protein